ncbi:50S ribosomal protein L20 [Mesomycoplasma hyopneumoniae 168]|nr:50S ribosomal protein L20 [Mesomycoplasma hyopneumoniae 168]AGM21962.1 50S ribosomal protein L20 [Mesomycoplasma hyopneumoniae 168-L]
MHKIKQSNIEINRKMLAEMAIHHQSDFENIVKLAIAKSA